MPNATYTLGLTVVPDWPTWRSCGIQPASTSGRDEASVAPSLAATRSNSSMLSRSPMPRPIETITSAPVMSTSPAGCST